jgi:hypothetical protein
MMTIHKLTAGDGYMYLIRQVAASDSTHRGRPSLDDYYSSKGETPGRWMGRGLAELDRSSGVALGDRAGVAVVQAARRVARAVICPDTRLRVCVSAWRSGDSRRVPPLGTSGRKAMLRSDRHPFAESFVAAIGHRFGHQFPQNR